MFAVRGRPGMSDARIWRLAFLASVFGFWISSCPAEAFERRRIGFLISSF
jgi:hypothetical protein